VFASLLEAKVLVKEYTDPLQPPRATQLSWLPDSGGLYGVTRASQSRWRPYKGARIGNCTPRAADTENGVRSIAGLSTDVAALTKRRFRPAI